MIPTLAITKVQAVGVFNNALREATARGLSPVAARAAAQAAVKDAAPRLAIVASASEGAMSAGSVAADFARDGELTSRESIGAAGAGVATSVFGKLGGDIGRRIGLGDVDVDLASGTTGSGLLSSVMRGGLQEGFLEELPQSIGEQIATNYGAERPLFDGVGAQQQGV